MRALPHIFNSAAQSAALILSEYLQTLSQIAQDLEMRICYQSQA